MIPFISLVIYFVSFGSFANAYWRMACGTIQTGRIDPVVNFGGVASHAHKISGASLLSMSSTYNSLQQSRCTSCEVRQDLSAYWTPQLYYQHNNGQFEEVPNSGSTIYYLGRGDMRDNIQPFPPGFKMLSGNTWARSQSTSLTYLDARNISDRVSFACLSSAEALPETPNLVYTDCDNGLRAQIHFQSCWDGENLYKTDNSHVDYLSSIDNGVCPPTHPVLLIHLFIEVLYGVNDIDTSDGGQFVFSNGDPTGYGFHGDFINGWDADTLMAGINQCLNDDSIIAPIQCSPFQVDPYFATNCPEELPILNEPVHGILESLPGCNPVTPGPGPATPVANCTAGATLNGVTPDVAVTMYNPQPGDGLGTWNYVGCAAEPADHTRLLDVNSFASDLYMTIQACQVFCASKNQPYAGVEYSTQCWCGNQLDPDSVLDPATCNSLSRMICSGNTSEWCGAPGLLDVWGNPTVAANTPVPGVSTILNGEVIFAGCYSEGENGLRALSQTSMASSKMTNELCATFCTQAGWELMGTEYASECYCGNDLENGSVLQSTTDCSMACSGNSSAYCGAGSRLSVWNATVLVTAPQTSTSSSPATPTETLGYFSLGCFAEPPNARALPFFLGADQGMTVELCLDAALQYTSQSPTLVFPYIGLEYGGECWGGTTVIPSPTSLVGTRACTMTCNGNSLESCGGPNMFNYYVTTAAAPMATNDLTLMKAT